jgi:hypothetical protein
MLLVAERGDEILGALIAGWDGWRGEHVSACRTRRVPAAGHRDRADTDR